jgi:hypothetical protein
MKTGVKCAQPGVDQNGWSWPAVHKQPFFGAKCRYDAAGEADSVVPQAAATE